MTSHDIFASALALVAVAFAAPALIISWRLSQGLTRWRSMTASSLRGLYQNAAAELRKTQELQHELRRSTPATLAAEVAELSAAVAKLAATQRRFAGKFHAERQHSEPKGNGQGVDPEVDDEIAAHLALQTAPPRAPGT